MTSGTPGPDDAAANPESAPGDQAPPAPDPDAVDSERDAAARARGLAAPYIAGGRDPDPDSGQREERFYLRLLLAMVAIIVLGGFVLGIIASLLSAGGG